MLTLDATQQALVAADVKKEVSWLFEIDTDNDGTPEYRYSTKAKSFGGQSYTFKVLDFSPVKITRNKAEAGLLVPNKMTIVLDNHDDALTPSDFDGAGIDVKLVIDDGTNTESLIATWGFEVIDYQGSYKKIKLECRDWLQKYLQGDYPNTPLIKDLFPSDDPEYDIDDNVCVPIIYGTGYFPIRSVYIGDTRYYILGEISTVDVPTYSITKVRSPRALESKSEWDSGSYTFNQYEFRGFEELGSDLMTNGGFETAGAGGADIFANWTETASDGAIADETSLQKKDSHAVKLTAGAAKTTRIGNTDAGDRLTVVAETDYKLSLWTRGDGSNSGQYQIYDHSNGANITAKTSVGVTGTTYTYKEFYFTTPAGCTSISITLWNPDVNGGICYFDDIQVRTCTRRRTDGDLYKVAQFIIADSDADGTADANGLFRNGENFHDVPCKYSRNDTNTTTNPADIIEAILLDMGVPSGKIDATTQNSVATTLSGRSFTWNLGLWYKMDRTKYLSKLLKMSDVELIVRDKIYFKVHSKTSKDTIDNTYILKKGIKGAGSFSLKAITGNEQKDSLYIAFQEADEPIDKLIKIITPAKTSISNIANTVIECDYIQNSQHAQIIGTLNAQRLLLLEREITFSTKGQLLALEVDDVITIANDANYGAESATYDILIDSMTINKDLRIDFDCSKFNAALDDWGDISPNSVTIADDDSTVTYSPVICGPDTTGLTGTSVPNALTGRLRVGNDTHFIVIDPDDSGDRYIASGKTDFETANNGFIIGIDHSDSDKVKLYLGDATDYMYWNGANLYLSGDITATSGTIGGWTISATTLANGTDIILDAGNKAISINDATYGNQGIQLEYNAGTPRFYVGDGASKFIKFDGTNVLTSDGEIKQCTLTDALLLGDGSTISGTITLNIAAGQGDCYIAAGKSDFGTADSGFILGQDDSDSDKAKFYIGDATNYFYFDGTDVVMSMGGSDAITIASGGDIKLVADATNPGLLKFEGTTHATHLGSYLANGTSLNFMAQTDNAITLSAYNGSNYFSVIQWYCRGTCSIGCIEDSNNQATIVCDRTSNIAQAYFYMRDGGTTKTLEMRYDSGGTQYFAPNDDGEWDLGNSTYSWKNLYVKTLAYIGDTANTFMTAGLTINQGAGDNECLALKSSDVGHGMTALAEADTYSTFEKYSDTLGGVLINGYCEATGETGIQIRGHCGTTADETTTTAAVAPVEINSYYDNGAGGSTACSGNDNVLVVRTGATARFIVKGDGDIYYDGADQGAFDDYEDALACSDLSNNLSKQFGKVIKYNREKFHKMGVIAYTKHEEGGEDIFVSVKGMTMLQLGAIGELFRVCNILCEKLGISYEEAKQLT